MPTASAFSAASSERYASVCWPSSVIRSSSEYGTNGPPSRLYSVRQQPDAKPSTTGSSQESEAFQVPPTIQLTVECDCTEPSKRMPTECESTLVTGGVESSGKCSVSESAVLPEAASWAWK